MKNSSSSLDLKIFGWLGFLAIAAGVIVVPVLIALYIASGGPVSTLLPAGALGAEGSICGGGERLPCNAGLICTHTAGSVDLGTCERAPEVATSTDFGIQKKNGSLVLGEPCADLSQICAPALVCRSSITVDECGEAATSSPRILSVKIEGAQLNDGVYRVIAGTKAAVTIQAVNAKSVASNFGTVESAVSFKQGRGGIYTADVTFPSSVKELNLVAQGTDGTWSGLVMKVATVEAVR